MTQLFEWVIEAGHMTSAFPIHEYWLDVGRLDDLDRANAEFEQTYK
jgi:NDP-sugar pyrophosphorylase family protein